jgi:hypothetical protein
MKFSTSKVSLTDKSSKDERQPDLVEAKADYNKPITDFLSKWEHSTGF